jgi:sterol desaturase/sphingolipid hydroxylase (fatty acid hydroxylase superfamily)
MTQQTAPPDKDPKLWEIAQKRASFKTNLITYLIVNAFLWVLWYINTGKQNPGGIPWPVWPTLGWGLGLLFHYFGAYVYPEANSVEKEYEKLKNKH